MRRAILPAALLAASLLATPFLPLATPAHAVNITINTDLGNGGIYGNSVDGSSDNLLSANDNIVTIADGGRVTYAYASLAYSGSDGVQANNNYLTIANGGVVDCNLNGAEPAAAQSVSDLGDAEASGNTLTIGSGGWISAGSWWGLRAMGAEVIALNGNATALNNTVAIFAGQVENDPIGGYASSYQGGDATALGNKVIISGGAVSNQWMGPAGGYACAYNGNSTASNNTVI